VRQALFESIGQCSTIFEFPIQLILIKMVKLSGLYTSFVLTKVVNFVFKNKNYEQFNKIISY